MKLKDGCREQDMVVQEVVASFFSGWGTVIKHENLIPEWVKIETRCVPNYIIITCFVRYLMTSYQL
jgi:hypothetical protein